jgi:hypothetical protein
MTSRMHLSTAGETICPDVLENAIPLMPHITFAGRVTDAYSG